MSDTGKEEGDDPQIIELKDSDDYGHMTRIGNTSGDTMASRVKYKCHKVNIYNCRFK